MQLRKKVKPRSDAASWVLIAVLPAHPVITLSVGVAATGRSKPAVNNSIPDLAAADILRPLSQSQRNRAWEASELLDLIVDLEAILDESLARERVQPAIGAVTGVLWRRHR